VRFNREVASPVIGLMIRTRVGVEVYGASTEQEKVILGKRTAGEVVRVTFRFNCDLCPQDYTVTAASHDSDGTRHDWLDDAVLISVTDSRFTHGIANLRAQVTLG
jgi:lipopolysaccharide transport system ATP-binding protein